MPHPTDTPTATPTDDSICVPGSSGLGGRGDDRTGSGGRSDPCQVDPTATPTVIFITNTLIPSVTPSSTPDPQSLLWYVTNANLTNGLVVRSDVSKNSPSILPYADRCSEVQQVDLDEYDDPDSNITRVKIYWPPGSTQVGYIAIRDADVPEDGDYLVDNYESLVGPPHSCPAPTATPMPTATFDPSMPLFSPGRFGAKANGTPLQIASVFTTQSPATVGILGIHEGGTVDLAPRNYQDGRNLGEDINSNLEFCLDAGILEYRSSCDGMTVYYLLTDVLFVMQMSPVMSTCWSIARVLMIYPA